jgi:hypothetical protein
LRKAGCNATDFLDRPADQLQVLRLVGRIVLAETDSGFRADAVGRKWNAPRRRLVIEGRTISHYERFCA